MGVTGSYQYIKMTILIYWGAHQIYKRNQILKNKPKIILVKKAPNKHMLIRGFFDGNAPHNINYARWFSSSSDYGEKNNTSIGGSRCDIIFHYR